MMIKKAVIPAAGLGTRFLPATKAQPKEMLPIIDTPVIQYVIQECVDSGIEDILIISGKGKRSIEDHFDRNFELEAMVLKKEDEEILTQLRHIENMANIHFIPCYEHYEFFAPGLACQGTCKHFAFGFLMPNQVTQ